jgi:hypothetical protein
MIALTLQYQTTIESLIYQIIVSRRITQSDRQQLRSILSSALLEGSLSEAEHILIDRLLYGIRHGLLKMGD